MILKDVTLCVRVWIEICFYCLAGRQVAVTLCVRVWIEMSSCRSGETIPFVTLCVRVWIEISIYAIKNAADESHPLREGVD